MTTWSKKYGDAVTLLFTDTDSLCCEIRTDDLYENMRQDLDLYDTSNFALDHPLYSAANHRVLRKFKSETGSLPPTEFVGLRAKMYSLLCDKKSQKKNESGPEALCKEDYASRKLSRKCCYPRRQNSPANFGLSGRQITWSILLKSKKNPVYALSMINDTFWTMVYIR